MHWTRIDQQRWEAVEALVRLKPGLFARQGTVRTAKAYFDLCYRDHGVQQSIHLGRSQALADRVAELLDTLHAAKRQRRVMKRLLRQARTGLRRRLAELDAMLTRCGVPEEPFEIRDADFGDTDLLDVDLLDAEAPSLDLDQDPQRREPHPTGGRGRRPAEAVFDDALIRSSKDKADKLLKACATLVRVYAKFNNSPTNEASEGDPPDDKRS